MPGERSPNWNQKARGINKERDKQDKNEFHRREEGAGSTQCRGALLFTAAQTHTGGTTHAIIACLLTC